MQNGRMEPIVFHSLTESNYKKICHLKKKSANHASSIILIIVLGILYMLKRFCVVSTSYKLKPIYYYSASSHQASVQNHYPQWVGSGVWHPPTAVFSSPSPSSCPCEASHSVGLRRASGWQKCPGITWAWFPVSPPPPKCPDNLLHDQVPVLLCYDCAALPEGQAPNWKKNLLFWIHRSICSCPTVFISLAFGFR